MSGRIGTTTLLLAAGLGSLMVVPVALAGEIGERERFKQPEIIRRREPQPAQRLLESRGTAAALQSETVPRTIQPIDRTGIGIHNRLINRMDSNQSTQPVQRQMLPRSLEGRAARMDIRPQALPDRFRSQLSVPPINPPISTHRVPSAPRETLSGRNIQQRTPTRFDR